MVQKHKCIVYVSWYVCAHRCASTRRRFIPWRSGWWCPTVSWKSMNAGFTRKNSRPTRSCCSTRADWTTARGDWGSNSWRKTRKSKESSTGHNPVEAQCVCMCVWRSSLSKAQKKACRPPLCPLCPNLWEGFSSLILTSFERLCFCVLSFLLHVVVWMWNNFVMVCYRAP